MLVSVHRCVHVVSFGYKKKKLDFSNLFNLNLGQVFHTSITIEWYCEYASNDHGRILFLDAVTICL